MMNLARLFPYTLKLERRCLALVDRLKREREEHRRELAHETGLRMAAEALAEAKESELQRLHEWNTKLSEQNFGLTDRICLQNRVQPTSEPLKQPKSSDETEVGELLDRTVRRSGPVAAAR